MKTVPPFDINRDRVGRYREMICARLGQKMIEQFGSRRPQRERDAMVHSASAIVRTICQRMAEEGVRVDPDDFSRFVQSQITAWRNDGLVRIVGRRDHFHANASLIDVCMRKVQGELGLSSIAGDIVEEGLHLREMVRAKEMLAADRVAECASSTASVGGKGVASAGDLGGESIEGLCERLHEAVIIADGQLELDSLAKEVGHGLPAPAPTSSEEEVDLTDLLEEMGHDFSTPAPTSSEEDLDLTLLDDIEID